MQDELVRKQPEFKQNLLDCVAVFKKDVDTFMEEYDRVSNLVQFLYVFSVIKLPI